MERESDEAARERLAHYLTERYDVELLDAYSLVRRYLDAVSGVPDDRGPTSVTGDALAAFVSLRERTPRPTT